MDLKDQIRLAREAKGYDVETLAEKLDVSAQAVKFWELGKGPKLTRVKAIEDALETKFNVSGEKTFHQFLGEVSQKTGEQMVKLEKLPLLYKETIFTLIDILYGSVTNKRVMPFNDLNELMKAPKLSVIESPNKSKKVDNKIINNQSK